MNPPSAVELEVRRIRELVQERRFAEALGAVDALLVAAPENRDVLYQRALSQRLLGDIPAALATLAGLEQLHPRFSRLYQERGHCYVALKQAPQAIDAFLRGVHINPALPASWSMLEALFRMTRQAENAADAAAHVATLRSLPPEVVTATALFSDGELAESENLIRAFLLEHGHHVEAMRLLARIGIERDVLDDAQLLLEAVMLKS
jgi:tetratricopeptide (TPR) repeat protein